MVRTEFLSWGQKLFNPIDLNLRIVSDYLISIKLPVSILILVRHVNQNVLAEALWSGLDCLSMLGLIYLQFFTT